MLARGASAVGLDRLLGAPSGAQTAASDAAGRQAYNASYGNSLIAGGARLAGQIAGTAPIIASGAGLLGAAGDAAAAAAGPLGPAIDAAGNVLAGTAGNGLLGRGASLAASGGATGAAMAGLTSGASDAPLGQRIAAGAEGGAVAGQLGGLVAGVGRGLGGALGSGSIKAADTALAQTAIQKYGIDIPASRLGGPGSIAAQVDQMTGKVPFSGAGGQGAQRPGATAQRRFVECDVLAQKSS